jgi:hypothetical protein
MLQHLSRYFCAILMKIAVNYFNLRLDDDDDFNNKKELIARALLMKMLMPIYPHQYQRHVMQSTDKNKNNESKATIQKVRNKFSHVTERQC